jgi:lysine-specific histone demethylase 1
MKGLDSRRSTRTSLASPAKLLSPAVSTFSDSGPIHRTTQLDSANGLEDIAPEIVVWTGDMDDMLVDSPEPATPATPALEEEKPMYVLVAQLLLLRPSTPSPWSHLWHIPTSLHDVFLRHRAPSLASGPPLSLVMHVC